MLRGDLVPLDFLAAGFQVDGVQAEAVFAGDETERLGGVGAEFVGRTRPAGIIARGDNAAGKFADPLEARHVVPLPALHGNRDLPHSPQRGLDVDAQLGVTLFG